MFKILSILVLILMVALLVPTGLVLASQDSVPGDATYPIKRQLENIIVSVASVSPATKAYFVSDFSKRRFQESSTLFTKGDNQQALESLTEMTAETSKAIDQILAIKDKSEKERLRQQLLADLKQRKVKLEEIKTTITSAENLNQSPLSTVPTATPQPTATVIIIVVTPKPGQPTFTPTPSPRPTLAPAPTPRGSSPAVVPGINAAGEGIDEGIGRLENPLLRTTSPVTTPTPIPPPTRAKVAVTPTPVSPATPEVSIAGDGLPTPTPRVTAAPQATPDYPGCPAGGVQAQCMSDSEKTVYGSGVNAVCYNSANQGVGNICLPSCGSCN